MMRIFLIIFVLLTTPTFAQDVKPESKRFLATQACDPVIVMADVVMNRHKELPLFEGKGLQFSATDGRAYQSDMMFFVNQDTGSFSLVSLYPDGMACMVAVGRDFEPYTGSLGKIKDKQSELKPNE